MLLCCCAEWHFRSSLDRYVWIHGMICAYMKPWAEGILVRIDNMAFRARIAMRALLLAGRLLSWFLGSCCCPAEATPVMKVPGTVCSAPT